MLLFARLAFDEPRHLPCSLGQAHRLVLVSPRPGCAFGNGSARFSSLTTPGWRSSLRNFRSTVCAAGFNGGLTAKESTLLKMRQKNMASISASVFRSQMIGVLILLN